MKALQQGFACLSADIHEALNAELPGQDPPINLNDDDDKEPWQRL